MDVRAVHGLIGVILDHASHDSRFFRSFVGVGAGVWNAAKTSVAAGLMRYWDVCRQITTEGIEQNPAVYEMMAETRWACGAMLFDPCLEVVVDQC